jgi:hypothetical protein
VSEQPVDDVSVSPLFEELGECLRGVVIVAWLSWIP